MSDAPAADVRSDGFLRGARSKVVSCFRGAADMWTNAYNITKKLIGFVVVFAIFCYLYQFYYWVNTFTIPSMPRLPDRVLTPLSKLPGMTTKPGSEYTCREVFDFLENNYFLSPAHRWAYCDQGCVGLSLKCSSYEEPSARDWVRKAAQGDFNTILSENVGPIIIDEAIQASWWVLVVNCFPAFFAIIPILLNQYKHFDFKGACALIVMYLITAWFGFSGRPFLFYNIVVCITCLAYPAGSSGMVEALAAWVVFVCLLCATFFTTPAMQVIVVFVALICYVAYVGSMFISKRKHCEPAVIMMIAQVMIMAEQLSNVRENFMLSSYSTVIIEMALNTVYPSGFSNYLCENILRLSQLAMKKMPVSPLYQEQMFLIYAIGQLVAFLCFRAGLGAFYVSSKRYDVDGKVLLEGLATYMADLFGPLMMVWKMATGRERIRGKRITYGIITCSLSLFELNCAFEIFCVRFLASVLNVLLFSSSFSDAPYALALNVNMLNAPYPQRGSRPWVSLVELGRIADAGLVTVVNKRHNDSRSKGLGLMVNNQQKNRLVTVKHVVNDFKTLELSIPGQSPIDVGNLVFGGHNDCQDPVVSATIGFGQNLPKIDVVSPGELPFIRELYFINRDEDGETMLNSCGKFTVDMKAQVINAAVDLKHGDSGGPVIGFLNDGTPRLMGGVSKGNPSQLGGNVISLACLTSDPEPASDSDESTTDRLSATFFNGVRNPRRLRKETAIKMRNSVDVATRCSDEDEVDRIVDGILVDQANKRVHFVDEGRAEGDNWKEWADDEDVQERGKERGKQTKSKVKADRKNRAARKRQATTAACDFCTILYGEEASRLLSTYLIGNFDFKLKDDEVLGFHAGNFKAVNEAFFGI